MSSGEEQTIKDIVNVLDSESMDEKSEDVVMIDDDEESSSEEDNGSSEETDNDEVDNADDDDYEGASDEEYGDDVSAEGDDDDDNAEDDDDDDAEDEDDDDDDSDEGEKDEAESEQEEEQDNADMSSGDENSDRCPICLNILRKQDIGTPESCDHSFCLECIQEWAKNVNTCPVDRQVFRLILARHAGEEKIFKQFPVEDKQQDKEEEEEDPTYCEVCGQSNREDRLLLCDRCDLGYHCDCLDPPLASVPVHEWFCPDCQQEQTRDSQPVSSGRQIARTRVSERVRRLIAEARAERAERRRRVAAMIEAQEDLEDEEPTSRPSSSGTSASSTKTEKKSITCKRKTYRRKTTRRKTKKRKTSKKKTGKKTKTRRRKTKGKGKRKVKKVKKRFSPASTSPSSVSPLARTAFSRSVTSVKGRIADKLGLSKPPVGRSIPMQKLPVSGARQESNARFTMDFGASNFSILGSKDELYLFADQEGEERQPVNRPAVPAKSLLSQSAKSSHKPLSLSLAKKKITIKDAATSSLPTAAPAVGGFDVLGSIMQNQDLLYKASKHVTIHRDGSLSAKTTASSSSIAGSSSRFTMPVTESTSSPAKLSSTHNSKSHHAHNTIISAASSSGTKPAEINLSSNYKLSNSTSMRDSKSRATKSESNSDSHYSAQVKSKMSNFLQSDSTKEMPKFVGAASSDEKILAVTAEDDRLATKNDRFKGPGDKENVTNIVSKVIKSTNSCLENSSIESSNVQMLERETHFILANDRMNSLDGCHNESSCSSKSSSDVAGHLREVTCTNSFAELPATGQESKPTLDSECSSNEAHHIASNNSSSEIGSKESDSNVTKTAAIHAASDVNSGLDYNSSRTYSSDVNTGLDLEADATFSNNARLNGEEGLAGNSIGMNTSPSSMPNLRNFAAVGTDMMTVHDDSLSIMKRNLNLLVSTSSNLAGYESGEENDDIERYMHLVNDREEGEASESNEEGDATEHVNKRRSEDPEDGEIVEEEERDRWAVGRGACEEDDNEDSGGLDVNAIHIEEMEIGTFRKRSMSQNEDNNNEENKRTKSEEKSLTEIDKKRDDKSDKNEVENKEQEESDEDDDNRMPVGRSFALSSLLQNLKAEDGNSSNCNSQKVVKNYYKPKKLEETKERVSQSMKPISILDFIGEGDADVFGLSVKEDRNAAKPVSDSFMQTSLPKKDDVVSEHSRKQEEITRIIDLSKKPISILDFIGGTGADKFGLEEDGNTEKPVGQTLMSSECPQNMNSQKIDQNGDSSEKGLQNIEDCKKQEEVNEDNAKIISILDFIGDASAEKFGLVEPDSAKPDEKVNYSRGNDNIYDYRGSTNYENRRYNNYQRDRRGDDTADGFERMKSFPQRSFDRRRSSWQENDRNSQISQDKYQRSDSHDLKQNYGRKDDSKRRKRDFESRDRSWRSRSPSESPRRKSEKRSRSHSSSPKKREKRSTSRSDSPKKKTEKRRHADHDGKSKHNEKGKRSKWNNEEEEEVKNVKANVENQDKEVVKSNEKKLMSAAQYNGLSSATSLNNKQQQHSGQYQSHEYKTKAPAYSYSGAPAPPMPSKHAAHPPHSHTSYPQIHPQSLHPALSFNHHGHQGQSAYSQIQHALPTQQAIQTRQPYPEFKSHPGYPNLYYPPPHPPNIQNAPPLHPYPYLNYPMYPSQSGQHTVAVAQPNSHVPATIQPPPTGYPRPQQPAAHTYQQSVPHAAYPPRQSAPSTTPSTVAASIFPSQPPITTSTTAVATQHSYNSVAVKQDSRAPPATKPELSAQHAVTNIKQDSTTSVYNSLPMHSETHKIKEIVKESTSKDVKPTRSSYPISPPAAPLKGVTAYDKVDSSILLNEVKIGFRQLVEDAVRTALKGPWSAKKINKDEYKDILKRAVEKVCGSKETVVHQGKIQSLVNAYVSKARKLRKAMGSSN